MSTPKLPPWVSGQVVRVEDGTGGAQLRGKQSLNPRGIWYSRVSGIWQAVWLEAVTAPHTSFFLLSTTTRLPALSTPGWWLSRGNPQGGAFFVRRQCVRLGP
jgi:hypothetical protein